MSSNLARFIKSNMHVEPEFITRDNQCLQENKQSVKRYCLIVEDQPIVALIEKILLVEQGCEVDIVENGEEAIQQAQKNQYDFILMDIGLPGIDGYEATKNVRDLEKNSDHQTFIVGITGHVDVKKKKLL